MIIEAISVISGSLGVLISSNAFFSGNDLLGAVQQRHHHALAKRLDEHVPLALP
ncbi:hypothetical protein [Pseudaminobacter soli (ex Li et al. 2025)]|uniref:hypothetical protein n=1 Tax=Pseudaminobacter soli (ex Li et al. 2025) TaxID=1295366 RepID=UPI0015E6D277|nr:hypothetical protein [Mesorhizobium soli]